MTTPTITPSAQSLQTARAIVAILAGRKISPESRQTARAMLRKARS